MHHYLEKIKNMLCEELEEIANKGELSSGSLDTIHKLTDTIKNIDKIEMLEEDGGYSQGGGDWEARGTYGRHGYHHENSYDGGMRGGYHDGGNSYRGRKRDSMGRYSKDDGKDHMIKKLHEMMDDAESEKEREAIRRCIQQIENA